MDLQILYNNPTRGKRRHHSSRRPHAALKSRPIKKLMSSSKSPLAKRLSSGVSKISMVAKKRLEELKKKLTHKRASNPKNAKKSIMSEMQEHFGIKKGEKMSKKTKKRTKKVAKKASQKKAVKKVSPKKARKKAAKKVSPKKARKKVSPKKARKKTKRKSARKVKSKKLAVVKTSTQKKAEKVMETFSKSPSLLSNPKKKKKKKKSRKKGSKKSRKKSAKKVKAVKAKKVKAVKAKKHKKPHFKKGKHTARKMKKNPFKKHKYSLKSNPIGGAMKKVEQFSKNVLAHDLGEAGGLLAGGAAIQGIKHLQAKFAPNLASTIAKVPFIGNFLGSNLDTIIPLLVGAGIHKFSKNSKAQAVAKGIIGASVVGIGSKVYVAAAQMAGANLAGIIAVPSMNGFGAMKMVDDFGAAPASISSSDFGASYGVGLSGEGGYLQSADFDSAGPKVIAPRNPDSLGGYDMEGYSDESEF